MRVRVRALRKQRVVTATIALTDQEEEKPLGRLSRQNPFRRIKMAWADPKAVITTDAPPANQDLVVRVVLSSVSCCMQFDLSCISCRLRRLGFALWACP